MTAKRANLAGRFCFRFDDFHGNTYLIPAAAADTFDKMNQDLLDLKAEERKEPLEAMCEMFRQYEIQDFTSYSFTKPEQNL
jgi:hypothetical protein